VLWIGVGVVIVAVGIVALPAPGPGFLVIALGAALLARESLVVARAADWVELRLREALKWARAWWKGAALAARAAVALCALGLAGLTGYLAYLRFFT
jgi:GMP synthase PP-ATPase subunit